MIAQAVPSVAWPHRSISPPGVNQHRWYFSPSRTANAQVETDGYKVGGFLPLARGKRRLGEVVFDRDGHHLRLAEPPIHHADGGRIAGKDVVGKCINDILAHGKVLLEAAALMIHAARQPRKLPARRFFLPSTGANARNAQTGASQRMPRSFFAFFQFSQRICCVSTSGYAVSCALSRSAAWSFTPVIWRLS